MNNTDKIQSLFDSRLVAINVGPRLFADALKKQGAPVAQVDWKPVAGGNKELQDILALIGGV